MYVPPKGGLVRAVRLCCTRASSELAVPPPSTPGSEFVDGSSMLQPRQIQQLSAVRELMIADGGTDRFWGHLGHYSGITGLLVFEGVEPWSLLRRADLV